MRFDFECVSICLSAHLSSLLRFFFPSCCQSIHHVYTFLYIITSQYHHPISRLSRSILFSPSDSHFLHYIINSTLSFPLPLPLLYLFLYAEQNHTVFFLRNLLLTFSSSAEANFLNRSWVCALWGLYNQYHKNKGKWNEVNWIENLSF